MSAGGERDLDLVLLGATGFTGGLVAADLVDQLAGSSTRWAVAGRSDRALRTVQERLRTVEGGHPPDDVVVVDVGDEAGLRRTAARTRVLATTVGPYARWGEPVVAACTATATDYLDITGEPAFVQRVVERYDAPARTAGVRVVSCCGFDSVPHDLGVQLAVEQLPRDAPLEVRGYVSAGGRLSGGTFASVLEALRGSPASVLRPPRGDAGRGRRVGLVRPRVGRVPEVGGWAVPLPTIDPAVVLRSAAALPEYGPDFRYGHFLRLPSLAAVGAVAAGAGGGALLARVPAGRRLMAALGPSPGDGPDEAARARGWFRVVLLGEGGGARVRIEVRGGDPGYGETSRMLVEAARCLVEDRDRLPDAAGALTPAVAFGAVLRERLVRRGMVFDVVAP